MGGCGWGFRVRRAIARLARPTADSTVPSLLRPLRDRAGVSGSLETTGLVSERRRQRAEAVGSILRSIASFVVVGIAAVLVLDQLTVNIGPILASAGIAGIAIGFGAQNLVRDFIAGVFMIIEDQYGVGAAVDLGPVAGTIGGGGPRTIRPVRANGKACNVRKAA